LQIGNCKFYKGAQSTICNLQFAISNNSP
jgi:hypothetical protein